MHASSFILGLLTGLILAGLYYWKRQRSRPRADVHLKVKRGQSPEQMVSGVVQAIKQVDVETANLKRRAEQAERDRDYWKARAEEGGKILWLQLERKKDDKS